MTSAAKLRMGHLRMENNKLEQDIVDMESTLHHQKARLTSDSSLRSQISKATGTSKWLSGAKGQLSGYRSHRTLPQNQALLDKNSKESTRVIMLAKSAGPTDNRRGRTQSYTPVSQSSEELLTDKITTSDDRVKALGSSESGKVGSRVKSAPVSHNTMRSKSRDSHHQRSPSLQGGVKVNAFQAQKTVRSNSKTQSPGKPSGTGERKVSFDLSDENELFSGFTDDPILEHREAIIKTSTRNTASGDSGSYSERIAHLKAKVIAKASANLKPELLTKFSKERSSQSTNTVQRKLSPKIERKEVNASRSFSRNSSRLSEHVQNAKPRDIITSKNKAIKKESPQHEISKGRLQKGRTAKDQRGSCLSKSEMDHDDSDAGMHLDSSVELWLSSLHLDDPWKCKDIFRVNKVTMENLQSLGENHLILMGITTDTAIHKIIQGITKLQKASPRTAGRNGRMLSKTSDKRLPQSFYDDQLVRADERVEESLLLKNSSPPSASYTPVVSSAKFSDDVLFDIMQNPSSSRPKIDNDVKKPNKSNSNVSAVFHESQQINNAKSFDSKEDIRQNAVTKNSGDIKSAKAVKPKRSKVLSSDVVNRTLTSGVQSAMIKLKQKQEQEMNAQKRQDRIRKAKKTDRDKMAEQHAKRLKDRERERIEQIQTQEGGDIMGGDEESSPEVSATFLVHQDRSRDGKLTEDISIQGGALLHENLPLEQSDQDIPLTSSSELHAVKRTPEERLKQFELNIQGVQNTDSSSTTVAQVELLQHQLESLKRDLATAARATSASADPLRMTSSTSQSATKSAGPVRGVYSSMSKNELMKEVRKQKEQHKKQIRLMESELNRLKHRDPVKNCELPEDDIHYHDADTIGEGTFSQVFHGYFNGSEVAIKRLKIPLAAADHNYFAEEVSLLHELRHPRVVLLLGVCTSGHLPLMVLEFMAGGSLYARIHDKSREYLDHIAYYQISRDIALGMNYLHRHRPQVLHLDMKSMNILLGSHGRAKIGDFGFAKLRHEAEALQKGKIQGTPAWMAPELLENTATSITDKVDVYSFGIILWEMLTGQQPYSGLSVFQVLEKVQHKKRPDIPQSCPDPLRWLIKACWDHKPNKRPSFKDILIALEALSFPPEWRSLLSAANIPREAMEDPTSARSIIALVNGSVKMTQQELDKLALVSHERVVENSTVQRDGELKVSEKLAERFNKLSDSSTISDNDIDGDSLEDESNSRIPESKSKLDSRYRLMSNEDHVNELPASYHTKHGKDDTLLIRSPRQPDDAASSTEHKIPAPPPVEKFLESISAWGSKPHKLLNTTGRNHDWNQGSQTRHKPGTETGRASLDPSMFLAQRSTLKTTDAGPHPSQLPSLLDLGEQQITSIAEILKRAVVSRRTALREDVHSLEHPSSDSLWSTTSDTY